MRNNMVITVRELTVLRHRYVNSEKKWRGFYNSLSKTELEAEWDEYWKD